MLACCSFLRSISPYSVVQNIGPHPSQTLPIMRNGTARHESPMVSAKSDLFYHERKDGSLNQGGDARHPVMRRQAIPSYELLQQPQHFNNSNLQLNDFMNSSYRKKLIPHNMMYKKEDLYDQNIFLKLQINDYRDDNVKLRTRIS